MEATDKGYLISPQQKHLWMLHPESTAAPYTTIGCYCMSGPLNVDHLEAALGEVVAEIDILHSRFLRLDGMLAPLMAAAPNPVAKTDRQDLQNLDRDAQDARLKALLAELAVSPDVADGPVVRMDSLHIDANEWWVVFSMPALCGDERSLENLVSAISVTYQNDSEATSDDEEEGGYVQYALVAEWLHELAESEEADFGRRFWRKLSLPDLIAFRLPFQLRSLQAKPFVPATQSLELSADAAGAFLNYCRFGEQSPEIVGAAAWLIVLSRLTTAKEMVLGMRLTGREDDELQDALGLFQRYLPLVSLIDENMSFTDLTHQVATGLEELSEYQDTFDWEHLLGRPEQPEESAFLPFCYGYRQRRHDHFATGLNCQTMRVSSFSDRFDVALVLVEDGERLTLEIDYDSSLFPESGIKLLLRQTATLCHNIAVHPNASLSSLSMLDETQKVLLTETFNQTEKSFPAGTLHGFFFEQAAKTPQAIAIEYEGETLTYGQLAREACRLAHHLRGIQDQPALIGVSIERSPEMLVGLLGILAAGHAYVPLDPDYPSERIAYMLEDSQAPILLTQSSLTESLPPFAGRVISVDAIDEQTDLPETLPEISIDPHDLAYLIYTSGSTGKPKGVMIHHGGVCNCIQWVMDHYPLTQGHRMMVKTPYSFDASVWEMFAPLWGGATLVLARSGGHKDAAYLVDMIVDGGITHTQVVPSLLEAMLEAGRANPRESESLERVFCGGEKLTLGLQDRFFTYMKAGLTNLYGPTEASVQVSSWRCDYHSPHGVVPIGPPMPNTKIHVVDTTMNPVGVGLPGECLVGGVGPARGYNRRPGATAAVFVPDPFATEPGARLYKTGDLVRWLPDGVLDYLGRVDFQVKLRGFRIELGEIEAVLAQHPLIRANVVLMREDHPGNQRLVAYVLADPGFNSEEAIEFLGSRLPDYMAPSIFVTLDEWPRTPSGKIDRKQLPKPKISSGADYIAPRTDSEKELAEIWLEVVRCERVGVYDNFFDLGGHSLMAMQLVSRIRHKLGVDIGVQQIFACPTLVDLAPLLDAARAEDEDMDEMEF